MRPDRAADTGIAAYMNTVVSEDIDSSVSVGMSDMKRRRTSIMSPDTPAQIAESTDIFPT